MYKPLGLSENVKYHKTASISLQNYHLSYSKIINCDSVEICSPEYERNRECITSNSNYSLLCSGSFLRIKCQQSLLPDLPTNPILQGIVVGAIYVRPTNWIWVAMQRWLAI
ncbi:hypothetical protein CIPAW_15G051800 [Carya illinoinensis]|uniref:Uncharacterized protein n=1 Tax=Carya illinoinensis TaxID=32201 RepID=A0A8T1N900_CARIL|nr:hypothetical protein CIPAW_15G051800 [Carya illinoinensis]